MKYPESADIAAQYLKQTIPRIVDAQVPPNPINFTLWYNYITGRNPRLSSALDKLIKLRGTYDETQARDLYFQYVIQEHLKDEKLSTSDITELATQLLKNLSCSADNASQMDRQLDIGLQKLRSAEGSADLNNQIKEIIRVIESVKSANLEFQKQLEAANQEIAALRDKLRESEQIAIVDPITQLFNRRAFDRHLHQSLDSVASAINVCLILLDLDDFKALDDTYGHPVADIVLEKTGELLQEYGSEHFFAAHHGAGEFALILTDTTIDTAAELAEKLRQRIQTVRLKVKSSRTILNNISASFGVTVYQPGDTAESIITRAQEALHLAKDNGCNRIEVFNEELAP